MGLPKEDRILERRDFSLVFKAAHGKSKVLGGIVRGRDYIVYWRQSGNEARLGFSFSRKVFRTAVSRNRAKRCLREYFRENKKYLYGDIVVRWLKRPKDFDFDTLTKPLQELKRQQGKDEQRKKT